MPRAASRKPTETAGEPAPEKKKRQHHVPNLPDRYASDLQLMRRYDAGRATIWRWASSGKLPKPRRVFGTLVRWDMDEVEAKEREWLALEYKPRGKPMKAG